MAVFPGAKYRPLNSFSNLGTKPRTGVAFHVNDSGSVNQPPTSLYNWIAGNNDMSCHFQLMSDGTIEQYVDTDNGSWCQMSGNDSYISVETQGLAGEPMNAAMIAAFGKLMAWLNATHGIPLAVVDAVGQRGLILHGDGGAAWGGHYQCPGVRGAQRQQILSAAQPAPTPVPIPVPNPMPIVEENEMIKITHGMNMFLLVQGKLIIFHGTSMLTALKSDTPIATWVVDDVQWRILVNSFGQPVF